MSAPTIDLFGPSTHQGAPQITPAAVNTDVNAALAQLLPLSGGVVKGNIRINRTTSYVGQRVDQSLGGLTISQTASGATAGLDWIGLNNVNITSDTLNVQGPAATKSSFQGSINGLVLTIPQSTITGPFIASSGTASITGTSLDFTVGPVGIISAGLLVQWAGGSDIVVSGGGTHFNLLHNNGTVGSQAMTLVGPQPTATVVWDDGTPDGGSAVIASYLSANDYVLTTDQGVVASTPMQTTSAPALEQAIGLYWNQNFGGTGFGGSRTGVRFQMTQNGAIAAHNNYQTFLAGMALRLPAGGSDLWSGAAGNVWAGTFAINLVKSPTNPGTGPVNFRGMAAVEVDYGCASGLSGTDASVSNIAAATFIRYANHQMVPAIWEFDRVLQFGQQPSNVSDGVGGHLPERPAKFGLQISGPGAFAIDGAHGRAIGSGFTSRAYATNATDGAAPNKAWGGIDWYNVDWTGFQFRGQGPFIVTGSASALGAGAVGVGGGYLSATPTVVSLDTPGSVCTGFTLVDPGAVLYPGLPCVEDTTGLIFVVSSVDGSVRPGIGGATALALRLATGQVLTSQIPPNPVRLRPTGLPTTFPAPGPTGPTVNLTWTSPTILDLNRTNGKITSPLLTNAANDAAAGAAGVLVGQWYRNGSIMMQRVA